MSLPPPRPRPGEPYPPRRSLPPAAASPPPPTLNQEGREARWRALLQQAARHRYWLKGAAIAYGLASCLLLGFLALLAAATLRGAVRAVMLAGVTQWLPGAAATLTAVIDQTTIEWSLMHRWALLVGSGLAGGGLWLRLVGAAQQIIRSDGDLASHLVPSLRQRLTTVLVAVAVAGLAPVALALVLLRLPTRGDGAIATPALLAIGQGLFDQGVRWGLALSTMALVFGLLYRASQKPTAKALPLLPGTAIATLTWLVSGSLLKLHLGTLQNHHWLYSGCSTVLLTLGALYVATLGLLLGGQYNKLIQRDRLPRRSPPPLPPPPPFESFTIPKRPYR